MAFNVQSDDAVASPNPRPHAIGPIRVAVVGYIRSGKSATVNSLVGDCRAALPGHFTEDETRVFYEYLPSVHEQPERYRMRVEFLDEEEIRHDIAHYCSTVMNREGYSGKNYDSNMGVLRLLEKIVGHDSGLIGGERFGDYCDRCVQETSLEAVTARLTEQALSTIRSSPVNPFDTTTLQWDTDRTMYNGFDPAAAVGDAPWRPAALWPFIRKVQVHCKTLNSKNLAVVDCPGSIDALDRHKHTMEEIMRHTDIAIDTHDYYEAMGRYFRSHYIPANNAHWLYVVTGDVRDSCRRSCDIAPKTEDRVGLDDEDRRQIKNTTEETQIAEEALLQCYDELIHALDISSDAWKAWQYAEGSFRLIYDRVKAHKKKVHIKLRAKQALFLTQKHCGANAKVLRTYDIVYQKFLQDPDKEDNGSGATGVVRWEDVDWTIEESGVPELQRQLEEKVKLVNEGRKAANDGTGGV